ncbi:MAG: GH3 auxin-responsive promoter family protein [Rhodothermales bacterium]
MVTSSDSRASTATWLRNATAEVTSRLPVRARRSVGRFIDHPESAQRKLLRRLLRRAADTEWGRRLDFEEISRAPDIVDAYRVSVPLHDYGDLRDDVQRLRAGARDVIWPGTFGHFAVSSGTASSGKIIPVSDAMLSSNRDFSMAVGLSYLQETGNLDFLLGKHLTLPGRIEEDPNFPGTMIGEVSGLQAEHAPLLFSHLLQAVPNEVAFLPNWERKLRAIAERTVDMDIRSVVMAPTWALVFFRELIRLRNDGTGSSVETVGEVWPNLQVFISGGVALSSYRGLLEEVIGLPGLHFLETYGASEGFFSFQDRVHDASMLLHLDNGVYFEFVRMDELGSDEPSRYSIGEVETDVRYALYVTTCSGLWAYNVGDVVRFTGTAPHRIVVAGRTSEMLDRYGEAVFGEEMRAALRSACERTGAHVRDFHVAPRPAELNRLPTHQWLVEFDRPPESEEAFGSALDEYLIDVNRHYQIRREAGAFDRPEVVVLPKGAFYAWLKATKERVGGQTKVPRMSEERDVADGVLAQVTSG